MIFDEPLRGLKRSPPRCLNSRPHLLPDSLRPSSAEPQWNSFFIGFHYVGTYPNVCTHENPRFLLVRECWQLESSRSTAGSCNCELIRILSDGDCSLCIQPATNTPCSESSAARGLVQFLFLEFYILLGLSPDFRMYKPPLTLNSLSDTRHMPQYECLLRIS